jgi:coenzyme F420-reducing hydrogenase delta subunit
MNLLTKISEALANRGLTVISESRRLRPAVITMKRGTVIPVHHFRKIRGGRGGAVIVAGIDPGEYIQYHDGSHGDGRRVGKMRDFYAPGHWIPSSWQDETGWCEPHAADGGYDARRRFAQVKKFRKILTMNEENIRSIKLQ